MREEGRKGGREEGRKGGGKEGRKYIKEGNPSPCYMMQRDNVKRNNNNKRWGGTEGRKDGRKVMNEDDERR